jgi:hypothetical protein
MSEAFALGILSRLHDAEPVDLDALLAADAGPKGGALPTGAGAPLSPALWQFDAGWACLGIRVTEPSEDVTALARHLAATAVERGIIPVILSTLDQSGFERFGFRVERLSGATPEARAAEEAELQGFWNFALILDAADLALMG